MKTEGEKIFERLLEETKKAYEKSDIKEKNWFYSVTTTSIEKNKPLIVGINWGVNKKWLKDGNNYNPQNVYPYGVF